MIKLGERIRELRLRDGRTQEALAGKLGVTAQAISRREKGVCYPDMEPEGDPSGFFLYLLHKANDAVGFRKARGKVEPQTVRVRKFAVACELRAALLSRPVLAGGKQRRCNTAVPVRFGNVDPLKVSHRRRIRPFYVVVPELTLRKAVCESVLFRQKDGAAPVCKQFAKLCFQFFGRMTRPKPQRKRCDGFRVGLFRFSNHTPVPLLGSLNSRGAYVCAFPTSRDPSKLLHSGLSMQYMVCPFG